MSKYGLATSFFWNIKLKVSSIHQGLIQLVPQCLPIRNTASNSTFPCILSTIRIVENRPLWKCHKKNCNFKRKPFSVCRKHFAEKASVVSQAWWPLHHKINTLSPVPRDNKKSNFITDRELLNKGDSSKQNYSQKRLPCCGLRWWVDKFPIHCFISCRGVAIDVNMNRCMH